MRFKRILQWNLANSTHQETREMCWIIDSLTVCVYICYPSFYLAKIYTVHVCTMVHNGKKNLANTQKLFLKSSLCSLSNREPITTRQVTMWFVYPELSALVYIWIITLLPKQEHRPRVLDTLTFSYLILNCKQFTKLYILLTCQQIGVNTFYKLEIWDIFFSIIKISQ
jgi:hypothetical protein